ncbi:hypothetical protein RHSIM_RhsimUnG0001600 [Rhododendron simsii]|uniref:Uncharacterized protein n=1 Tax=Rhododendron simsii TaxID=118357 RepID=A0A834FX04_RHOSS|nr:hypothetical protein RHSIM_RhsimUnG0001600 [Rhododendron simsii]
MQQKWLTKLLGYDYEIVYKAGQDNKVADALSRQELDPFCGAAALSVVQTDWLLDLKQSWSTNRDLKAIITDLANDLTSHAGYSWHHDLLTYNGKLVAGSVGNIKTQILQELHGRPVGGHSGKERTYKRVKRSFYWKGMKKAVFKFVAECDVCQRNKTETVASPGLLQPLPIPTRLWTKISMDFIEGLPLSNGKLVIFVVVNRLSKYVHFMALSHPYTAADVAQAFLDNVFKLHGMPVSIVSYRDVVLYGQPPPSPIHYIPGSSNSATVDQWGGNTPQPYKQATVQLKANQKLAPRFYGPYQIIQKVSQVAYKLALPSSSRIHPVFHVSLLKTKLGQQVVAQAALPAVNEIGLLASQPVAVLDRRLVKYRGHAATQLLVQWANTFPEEASWEFYTHLQAKFPDFLPCGRGSQQGGGNDTPPIQS